MSRAATVARVAAGVAGRRLRQQSGPVFYYGVAVTGLRVMRRVLGRRAKVLLVTELEPGEGIGIRALRRDE